MNNEEADRLRLLLERLAGADDMCPVAHQVERLAFDVRDCRLQLMREHGNELSGEQLRALQQLDFRLDGIRDGLLSWGAVPGLARQALVAFGWPESNKTNTA
jgi:hypothetical protein